jgi:uncharacterized protein
MDFILNLVTISLEQVLLSLQHNWPFLAMSVIIAALLKLYINAEKVSSFLNRHRGSSVVAATAAAVATPLCSCGTTAVVLGMMASTMPWAPIVAFMVASPLTSPEGLVYSAGLFGWPFAWAFYLASIFMGLAGGWIASIFDRRGWLANQTRFTSPAAALPPCPTCSQPANIPAPALHLELPIIETGVVGTGCGCSGAAAAVPVTACGCAGAAPDPATISTLTFTKTIEADALAVQKLRSRLEAFLKEVITGGKNLLVMFLGFAFIGYFLNGLIPDGWVTALFGGGNLYNIPLAATLGLPFYINSEASLPLVRSMLDSGMSQGAALAFLIAGAGTSIGAITGALAIARWRIIALVVGILWTGAMVSGYIFDLVVRLNLA